MIPSGNSPRCPKLALPQAGPLKLGEIQAESKSVRRVYSTLDRDVNTRSVELEYALHMQLATAFNV